MAFELQFFGATERVTGSLYVLRAGAHTVMLECGLVQGAKEEERRNREAFPIDVERIDAVVLSHSHIDHSGRIPRLVKEGFEGPIYTHEASRALCAIMLPDSGYLNEKEVEWENRKRRKKNLPGIEPLYTQADAEACIGQFVGLEYESPREILPGLTLTLYDAGHILGASMVELTYSEGDPIRTLVFSGDLGYRDAPLMDATKRLTRADAVLMESTYGDRLHRPIEETIDELTEVFDSARAAQGNVLIPAFTVGRTQDLLYLMAEHFDRWRLDDWTIFLDSPMGIKATDIYSRYRHLFAARLFEPKSDNPELPNLYATLTAEESMTINQIESGAVIIAGSGMCTGGRILHHLKNNIWRPQCHVVIVGYQAIGTLGRRLVDGAEEIKLWGDTYRVRAKVHTIGGLSAHGDQDDLVGWYASFAGRPPVYLVHGEKRGQVPLSKRLRDELSAPAEIARYQQKIVIGG
ncbi:MAG: MBL fold metallo-hydrolase [Gammaproteobacteria bacterium]|jgi:metallo-beta-lactamase family protein|nr:MBL fold metallo-hydrolase [Gammaproteobacteria bacterium]MDH3847406.1 MBL fold metallo-hydrolase [Gammaproteobacteria bacterium]MDH3864862.1 MBL fold metallo-hydrolase [Gammaproteobacteria bacterium]MDH3906077.1 MBL fold metallo-hydrolase [Gammaproteobacteria bacterium]MDH3953763.1 MBL fold metallo-hydrolase [Gammaproteobacteria bacterium]